MANDMARPSPMAFRADLAGMVYEYRASVLDLDSAVAALPDSSSAAFSSRANRCASLAYRVWAAAVRHAHVVAENAAGADRVDSATATLAVQQSRELADAARKVADSGKAVAALKLGQLKAQLRDAQLALANARAKGVTLAGDRGPGFAVLDNALEMTEELTKNL